MNKFLYSVLCKMGFHKWLVRNDLSRKKCSRCNKRIELHLAPKVSKGIGIA